MPCPCEVEVQGLLKTKFMSLYNDIDWSNWKRDEAMCAKAMPSLLQPMSNNFDRYVELLWTFKSVGHKCTEADAEARQYLRPDGQMFRVKRYITTMWW